MAGRFDDAREALRTSSPVLDDLPHDIPVWTYRWTAAWARELVGDDAGAERDLRARWRNFEELGEQTIDTRSMNSAYMLALFYCDRGRWDDAEECLAYGRSLAAPPYTRPSVSQAKRGWQPTAAAWRTR